MNGNWTDMFSDRNRSADSPADASSGHEPEYADQAPDPSVYRPWTLQRGRSRPALMLELRRFEPRSGLWSGWQLSYPTLLAVEYTGDRLLSLDFGGRQFVIEGRGLDELARHLQQGGVLTVQEYAAAVWPGPLTGPAVTTIRKVVVAPPAYDA